MSDAMSKQVGGTHYKDDKIQHAEFCHANGLPYIIANALKYVMRHRKKNGRQDLEKAQHYLEILLVQAAQWPEARVPFNLWNIAPPTLVKANNIPPEEAQIIYLCMSYHVDGYDKSLKTAIGLIGSLIRSAYPQD